MALLAAGVLWAVLGLLVFASALRHARESGYTGIIIGSVIWIICLLGLLGGTVFFMRPVVHAIEPSPESATGKPGKSASGK